jgi:3-oxosteroid 1-dehydrogenase
LSSGQLWPGPTSIAAAAGIEDDEGSAQLYLDHLSQGLSSSDLSKNYLARSREALRFFTDTIGLELEVVRGLPVYYYPAVAGSAPEGRFLEIRPFTASKLGSRAQKVLTSPYGSYYSYTTSNEWVQMQSGTGSNIGECLQRHVAADERCAGAGVAAFKSMRP